MASRKQLSCVNHFVGLVDNNIVIYPSSNDMYRRSIIYVIMDMGVGLSKRIYYHMERGGGVSGPLKVMT